MRMSSASTISLRLNLFHPTPRSIMYRQAVLLPLSPTSEGSGTTLASVTYDLANFECVHLAQLRCFGPSTTLNLEAPLRKRTVIREMSSAPCLFVRKLVVGCRSWQSFDLDLVSVWLGFQSFSLPSVDTLFPRSARDSVAGKAFHLDPSSLESRYRRGEHVLSVCCRPSRHSFTVPLCPGHPCPDPYVPCFSEIRSSCAIARQDSPNARPHAHQLFNDPRPPHLAFARLFSAHGTLFLLLQSVAYTLPATRSATENREGEEGTYA